MANKLFSDLVTFSRGTGATRVNSAGLIVGVDFSVTSNTIATGSKTFTLTADANVNRDWVVNSNVIAVAQSGATGSMTGTVTSYTSSTQSLVINVTSVTGSGTSTDWNIGSLDIREDYDPTTLVRKGVLSEVTASNRFLQSVNGSISPWSNAAGTTSTRTQVASNLFDTFGLTQVVATSSNGGIRQSLTGLTSGIPYTWTFFIKSLSTSVSLGFENGASAFGSEHIASLNPVTGVIVVSAGFTKTVSTPYADGFIVSLTTAPAAGTLIANTEIKLPTASETMLVGRFQFEASSSSTSYIPTSTTQITRNADNFPLTALAISAIRQGESTLYAEIDCPDVGAFQKRAIRLSGTNADIRIGKQGTGTFNNFVKMVEGGSLRLLSNSGATLISNNGLENNLVSPILARTGVASQVNINGGISFSGTSFMGSQGSFDISFPSDLSTATVSSIGSTSSNGACWTGTSFIVATATAGIIIKSTDGISYRVINTPMITQGCTEVTSGLVGAVNRVVIVGIAGCIATSDDDGETWTTRTSGTTSQFNAVAFGNNTFVAIASTASATKYSTNGIDWLSVTGITGTPLDITYTGSQFVAINTIGGVFTSANGITFTAVTTTGITPAFTAASGITFSNGYYVIVGNTGQVAISQTSASASPTTWSTFVTAQTGTSNQLNEVFTFLNNFYAIGGSQTVVKFNQSITPTFTSQTANIVGSLNSIAASPSTLLIAGNTGAMASSTNGTTFTSRTNNNQTLNGIAFGNNTFVSVGNVANGSSYISTIATDGSVTRRVSGTTSSLLGVKFLRSSFRVFGAAGTLVESSDGISYTLRTFGSATDIRDISDNGTLFVAVGNAGLIRTSPDFITWTTQTSGTAQIIQSVDFFNNTFVAVGNTGVILTSSNGTTWVSRTSGTTVNLNSVMYSTRDSLWYVAGNSGVLLYSPDAITWTAVQNSGTASILGTTLQSNQLLPQFKTGVNKIGISYKGNQVISALNGITSSTDITASIPSITAGNIGENLNGYIRKIDIYKMALTAAEISAKTL